MARGLNKVMLIGNLGADPEIRYTAGGSAVANIRLATAEAWRDRDSGEQQERTEWHRVVFFGRQAEVAGEYLKKGSQIYVEGSLTTRKWTDKDGNERYTTEIRADRMQMLGGRGGSGGAPGGSGGYDEGGYGDSSPAPMQQQRSAAPAAQRPAPAAKPAAQKPASFDDFEDDIPF